MRKVCNIANLIISFNLSSNVLNKRLEKYEVSAEPSYFIETTLVDELECLNEPNMITTYYDMFQKDDIIIQAIKSRDNVYVGMIKYFQKKALILLKKADYNLEYLLTEYATFYYVLKEKNALVIHASAISYHNRAYLFVAKSGTGKSTHAKMWVEQKLATYINDDKNIIVLENGKLYVYANPWSGKHCLDNNVKVELGSLIKLTRGTVPFIQELSRLDVYKLLLSSTLHLNDKKQIEKWEHLANEILNIKNYLLKANIDVASVKIVQKVLDGESYANKS